MKKVEINIFEFDELDEKIKQKLIKEETQIQSDFYCSEFLYDNLYEEACQLFTSLLGELVGENITNLKLLYNFDYSQGSGLLTEFDYEYKGELLKIRQNKFNHWYTYATNFEVDYDCFYSKITEDEIKELKKKIAQINSKLEQLGYSIIEDEEYHKQNAIEWLSNFMYFKNGNIFDDKE